MESKYNFKELMKERHSCRKFQSKPIPEETLKDIIAISLNAPSCVIPNHGIFMLLLEILWKK